MKAFDKLGGWILDTKSGFIFGSFLILILVAALGYQYVTLPKTVTISERDYACADTEPHGLGSVCTVYRKVH